MATFDANAFAPGAISDETLAFNAQMEGLLKDQTPSYQRVPQEVRDAREAGQGVFPAPVTVPEAQVRTIPGPGGDLGLRVFVPPVVNGVYLQIHGGGWVLGRAHHADVRNWAIAQACNLAVVSVDYRLAPEHPYPAGPDDCEAAARWLVANAKSEFGTERFGIGGESAGAHLAVVTLLRMRDRHGFNGFRAASLVYGVYDLRLTPTAATWGSRELVLSTPTMAWFAECFAKGRDLTDPDISPLFADLRGLPPALFTVGTLDVLLDDSLFMHSRWLAAGNAAEIGVYPGGLHGFNGFPTTIGREANARIDGFLRNAAG